MASFYFGSWNVLLKGKNSCLGSRSDKSMTFGLLKKPIPELTTWTTICIHFFSTLSFFTQLIYSLPSHSVLLLCCFVFFLSNQCQFPLWGFNCNLFPPPSWLSYLATESCNSSLLLHVSWAVSVLLPTISFSDVSLPFQSNTQLLPVEATLFNEPFVLLCGVSKWLF